MTPRVEQIGAVIQAMNRQQPERCFMRFSDGPSDYLRTISVDESEAAGLAIVCPAQTGKTDCCGTCALCWSTTRDIAFVSH